MRDVFSAIADPTRRRLLGLLAEADELPLHEMTARFRIGRTGVAKHLAVLTEAGLVKRRKVGRETRYHLNAAPLREIQEWVSFYERFWTERVERLKSLLEERTNERNRFSGVCTEESDRAGLAGPDRPGQAVRMVDV